jgi:hypothetical protein
MLSRAIRFILLPLQVVKAYQDSRETYHQVACAYQEIETLLDTLPKNKTRMKSQQTI